jgi:hypothetical protein
VAYFTLPQPDERWIVNRFDFTDQSVSEVFTLPGQTQDYAVFETPDGELAWFAASDGELLYRAGDAGDWAAIADLSPLGTGELSRLAVSPAADRLAIVIAEAD